MSCPLCERIKVTSENKYPYLIHEFKHSYLMLGEEQYHAGYAVLVLKEHYREMTDIPEPMRTEVFKEMMIASKAIEETFKPKKMNLCSLGNVVDHVHWHYFPRYESDPDFKKHPWFNMHLFESSRVTPENAKAIIQNVRNVIKKF